MKTLSDRLSHLEFRRRLLAFAMGDPDIKLATVIAITQKDATTILEKLQDRYQQGLREVLKDVGLMEGGA